MRGVIQIFKTYLFTLLLIVSASTVFPLTAFAGTYDWIGTTNEWNLGTNWKVGSTLQSAPPGMNDDVRIGVVAFSQPPLLSTGPLAVIIKSLTFGPLNNSVTLSINLNYNLTVNNDIKVLTSTSLFNNFTATIAGAGAIACLNVQVGDLTSFPTGLFLFINKLNLVSTISLFHVNSNVSVYSTTWGILGLGVLDNYAAFSLQGGNAIIDGSILTGSVNSGVFNITTGVATFSVDITSSASPVLQLTSTNPINTASQANSIDFYNNPGGTGTGTASVIYNYSGLSNQTVYTDNTTSLNNSPSTYQYLKLTGACNEVPNGSNLLIEKDLNTTATTVAFNSSNPIVSIGRDWANSSNVTQALGSITVVGSLTNNAGGTLNLGSANLSIGGDYINNSGGTYTQSTGTTNFNGTNQLLLDGSSGGTLFNNVTFSNGGTKSIAAGSFGVSTIGILSVLGSVTKLDAGGLLTMYASSSSPLAYAQIAPLTGTITGNVNYQVYFTGGPGYRNYRSMASPVYNNTNIYNLTNGTYTLGSLMNPAKPANSFIITGTGGSLNGFDKSSNNGATLRLYNAASNTYTFVTSISPTSPTIATGAAFFMYFRGSRIPSLIGVTGTDPFGTKTNRGTGTYATPDAVMYTYTGVPNQGSIISVPTFAPFDTKFYFVANPYAATLDANLVFSSSPIKATSWIWNPVLGNYAIYSTIAGVTANGGKRFIVPGQGFFIQAATAPATAHSLTITESMKSVTNNANAVRMLNASVASVTADPPVFRLKFSKDTILSDEIAVAFIDSAKATMDYYDATHLEGTNLTLSSVTTDNQYLAIDARPFTGDKTTMQLYITPEIDTTYTLKLSYKNTLMNNYKISLKDSLLNTITDISNAAYTFSVASGQPNTYAKRFQLIIEPLPAPPLFAKFTGWLSPIKKVALQWNNISNRNSITYQVQRSTDKKTFANIGNNIQVTTDKPLGLYQMLDPNPQVGLNYYRLMQTDMFNNNYISDTVAIAYNPGLLNGVAKNGFILYSNPVKDVVSIVSDKSYQGPVKLQIYNNLGQVQASRSFTGMDAQVAIQENVSNLKMGVYTAHIDNNNKEMVVIKFIKE